MEREGKNLDDIQSMNRALVVKYLSSHPGCSRAELSRISGLTQASITKIIRSLVEAGVVKETGLTEGLRGRRSIGLKLNGKQFQVLGVKLSRTAVLVGVYDIRAKKYEERMELLQYMDDIDKAVQVILRNVAEFRSRYPKIMAIGIAVPGPFFKNEGRVRSIREQQGCNEVDIRTAFSGIDIPVFIEHDVHAGAFACWWSDEDRSPSKTIVHFVASEGIGSGAVINGKVFNGSLGIAGEIGHVSIDYNGIPCECGNRGCLLKYCSSVAMEQQVRNEISNHPESCLSLLPEISVSDIFAAMNQGDSYAVSVVEQMGTYMGYGLQVLVNMYNPDKVIISDIMTGGGEVMMRKIREVLRERLLLPIYEKLDIQYSDMQDDVILCGAALIAIDRILSEPSQLLV